jgi:hypothetical protein
MSVSVNVLSVAQETVALAGAAEGCEIDQLTLHPSEIRAQDEAG